MQLFKTARTDWCHCGNCWLIHLESFSLMSSSLLTYIVKIRMTAMERFTHYAVHRPIRARTSAMRQFETWWSDRKADRRTCALKTQPKSRLWGTLLSDIREIRSCRSLISSTNSSPASASSTTPKSEIKTKFSMHFQKLMHQKFKLRILISTFIAEIWHLLESLDAKTIFR